MPYFFYVLLLPIWVISLQFSSHAMSLTGEKRQQECRTLGIIFTVVGILSLVSRDTWYTISGFAMIMLGLRLIAAALDRIDKKIFIDRFDEPR